ncbi:uncharacterized protein HaLaN_05102, partial [Haematococcus lacustris]
MAMESRLASWNRSGCCCPAHWILDVLPQQMSHVHVSSCVIAWTCSDGSQLSQTVQRQQIETGVKALDILGLDKPDELTKQDLVLFLYAIGLNPTDDVIDSKLRFLKLHQREVITFPQVCHVWHSMLQDLTDEDAILRRAFQYFDKDGNGEISVIELRTTMHELGDLLTESELLSFMQVMDANNDGVIGYQEWPPSHQDFGCPSPQQPNSPARAQQAPTAPGALGSQAVAECLHSTSLPNGSSAAISISQAATPHQAAGRRAAEMGALGGWASPVRTGQLPGRSCATSSPCNANRCDSVRSPAGFDLGAHCYTRVRTPMLFVMHWAHATNTMILGQHHGAVVAL